MSVLFQNDFAYSAMDQVAHRPYSMPHTPWVMTQTWHDLLFLHWPVDTQMLCALLPAGRRRPTSPAPAGHALARHRAAVLEILGIPMR